MLRSRFPTAYHFTVSVFGCQYHADAPDAAKLELIEKFDDLIKGAALHVEELEQNDLPSKIWMSYWPSPQSFKLWWENPATYSFWRSLQDDAGFWRETFSLPATRAMYESNQPGRSGFGHCGELIPLTEKSGYWGAYRSRMTPDSPEDKFESSLSEVPEPKALSTKIRQGRIRMTKFPENMCVVVEGQDYSNMPPAERDNWNQDFDDLTKQWVTAVVTGGPPKGMVSARACHGFAGGKMLGATNGPTAATSGSDEKSNAPNGTENAPKIFPGLDYVRQAQVLFWLDLSKMEHMGKWDKGHIKLRRNFFTAYGPGGPMEGGKILLWVDVGILKSNEIDAEYIGCYDGTGFLAYDEHPSFASEKIASAKLPAFFDEPIQSYPIEW